MPEESIDPAEKLALCRRSYAAFSDRLDIDAVLLLYHPECEWRMGSMGAAFGTESFAAMMAFVRGSLRLTRALRT
jgi:hypothetical protein